MRQPQHDAENDTTDPESSLQTSLSVLAEQEDIFPILINATETTNANTTIVSSHPTNPRDFLAWMIRALSSTVPKILLESNSACYMWCVELSKIAALIPRLSPFELHSVASEMVWMGNNDDDYDDNDDSTTGVAYPAISLLLCTHALQQAPSPTITRRSKRWQSLLCETIRQFQIHWERATTNHHQEDDEDDEDDDPMHDNTTTNTLPPSRLVHQLWIQMWCQHVVPAALKVLVALPEDASKLAIQCGLIATSTQLAAFCATSHRSSNDDSDGDAMEDNFQTFNTLLKTILEANVSRTTTDAGQYDELLDLWMYPWRKHEAEISRRYNSTKRNTTDSSEDEEEQWDGDDDDNDEDEDDCAIHRQDAIWWASQAQHHEHVVGMSTSYDDLGLAILAYYGWEDRPPKVLTPSHVWKVWFPHIKSLLLSSQLSGGVLAQRMGFLSFEQLLQTTPPSSITWKSPITSDTSSPGSPLPVFHLLSNRMLVLRRPDIEDPEEKTNLKRQTDQMVLWIKTLLYCYRPIDQVDMVQRLVQDCPHPGLQATFLDALRPLILKDDDQEVADKLWKYIGFLLDVLQRKYMPNGILINMEDLIDHLEIYIGSIAMLQLYVLVKSALPSCQTSGGETLNWEAQLKECHQVLTKTLKKWETVSTGSLPPSAFRLNLLEVSISEILRFIGANSV
ncbi:MAG: hypothetical protein SGBAC_000151 [Bacillariaceae sp.]